jgi:hypothetical protein
MFVKQTSSGDNLTCKIHKDERRKYIIDNIRKLVKDPLYLSFIPLLQRLYLTNRKTEFHQNIESKLDLPGGHWYQNY